VAAIVRNVSSERQTRAVLRESQTLLRYFLDHSPAAIYVYDMQGRYLMSNHNHAALLGLAPEQVIDRRDADFFAAQTVAAWRALDQQIVASRQPIEIEEEAHHPGSKRTFISTKFPFYDDAGNIYAIGGISLDITDRKQMEAELQRSQALLQGVLTYSPTLIVVKDEQGRYVLASERYCRDVFKRSPEQVLGKTLYDLYPPEIADPLHEQDRLVLEEGQISEHEDLIPHEDGMHTYLTIKFPLYDAQGHLRGLGAIGTDITERKRMEQARKQTAAELRTFYTLAQHAPDAIAVSSLDGVIVYSNAALNAMLGVETLVGSRGAAFISPAEQPLLKRMLQCVHEEGVWSGEMSGMRADGHQVPLHVSAFLVSDDSGQPHRMVVIARDISEQKQLKAALETALHQSQSLLQGVLDYSQALIFVKDTAGHILLVNRRAADLLGREQGQIVGEPETEVFPPDIVQCWHHNDQQLLTGGEPLEVEEQFPHPDGIHTYLSMKFPIYDQQGQVYAIGGISTDITERKRAEDALTDAYNRLAELHENVRRSSSLLRTLFDGLDDGLLLLDSTGCVLAANQSLAVLLGLPLDACLGHQWETLCQHCSPVFPGALALQTLRDGQMGHSRERVNDASGQVRVFDMQTFPLFGTDQAVEQVVLHIVDMTERLQLETLARDNERFIASGKLAASVAHEVNTPLQAIRNFLYLAHGAPEARRESYLELVNEEIERISRIVRQLLDVYRHDNTLLGPVDINQLVERVVLLTSGTLANQRINVERKLAPNLPLLQGRADQLSQVLLNVIVNAIDAMPQGGLLHIQTRLRRQHKPARKKSSRPASVVIIDITDNGAGMSEDVRARIFEPFFTTRPNGTGLGLAISKNIISQHNGTISVLSTPGQCSTFSIELPIPEASFSDRQEEKGGSNATGTHTCR
jgi:PAS domain S-box-containing protein